ncbi:Aldo/keto reductase family [Aspergillus sclerotialis]|uniref:Aldo/keto reductase family n=1 Tax=Aspergillus sclerotialis TaxID=2070753 RepID=A0A3A2ZLW5_9EURO|nr:Aldo/keto reductase family [Aspergillus sclerotialis]
MAASGAQYVLQAGLAAGMSATEGIHSPHPKPVDPAKAEAPQMLPADVKVDIHSRITLRGAKEDVSIPFMCIGAWPWGDKATFQFNYTEDYPKVEEAWETLKKAGLTFVDTSQAYGDGDSERICAQLFKGMPRDSFVIQTKWLSWPDMSNFLMQSHGPVVKLRNSLKNLELDYVDIYMVDGPIHPTMFSTVAKGMAECVHQGLTKAVGVTNYDKGDVIKMSDALEKLGVPLAVNQCEYSIVRRHPEISGLIRECRKRNIVFQGYASLANGRLSGKYSRTNEPRRTYRFSSYPMHYLEPTISVLNSISQERRVPIPAVALNYCINKGVVPLVGIRNPEQAEQNLQALGWRLTPDEIKKIETVSMEGYTTFLWQHG